MKILLIITCILLSQIIAFTFGRMFKGWLGFVQDILVWLAALIFIAPAVLLTNGQSSAGFIAWFISWAGAYSIGNIERPRIDEEATFWRKFGRTWLFPIWLIVWMVVIVWLASPTTPQPY